VISGTTQTATILVTDLVGSTAIRVRLGEEQADALRRVHDELLTVAVTGHGGTVVKGLGDGVLAMFPGAADAVAAAVEIQQEAHRHGRRSPEQELPIRVGLSAGDVTLEDDDCFGTPVIEASRLCAAADGGQVLAADLVEALARGRGGHAFRVVGELELKGLPAPVRTVEVSWAPADGGQGTQPPFPPLLHDAQSVPFVGRPTEVEEMTRLWKEALTGERRCALLAGEPGVGKTRLSGEIARRAHDDGAVVLLGRCDEELGLPFQPFVEALAFFAGQATPLPEDLGRQPGELRRLYPELADLVPGLGEPTQGDTDVERHRLFEATLSWLSTTAEAHGLVLVLDDLHWAGKPTLLLLRHLLRAEEASRILVIGTYRDTDLDRTHPLSELLADLRRSPGVERFPLSGFTTEEVEAFVAAAAGEELDDAKRALAAAVHAETEGNAFFVGEVLRHLAESGAIVQRDGVWQAAVNLEDMAIPEGVREVIGRRVSRLPESVNDVLRWASVMGRDVDFAVLADLVDGDEDDVLEALDVAIDARLVEETGAGRYRFVHALVRSTLLEEVRTTRRVRMHLRIGESIERRRPEDVTALAHHFAEAATAGGLDRALEYNARAGAQALDRAAFDEAAAFHRRALDLLEDTETEHPVLRIDLLIGLGTAQRAAGGGGHDETLLDAADRARALGDGVRMADALLATYRGWGSVAFAVNESLVGRIRDALDLLGEDDEALERRVHLLVTLTLELLNDPETDPWSLLDEARVYADRLGSPALSARVIGARLHVRSDLSSRVGSVDAYDLDAYEQDIDAVEVETARLDAEDPWLGSFGPTHRAQWALRRGEVDAAARSIAELGALAARSGRILHNWTATFHAAGARLYTGDHTEAEELIERAADLGRSAGEPDVEQYWGNQMLFLRRQQGRPEEMIDIVEAVVAAEPIGWGEWCAALALLQSEAGRADDARASFDRALVSHGSSDHRPFVPTAITLAHVAADLGAADAAPRLVDQIEPLRGQMVGWTSLASLGPADLVLGRLYLLQGRTEDAAAALVASAELCERGGLRPFLAQTRLAQGEVARAQGEEAAARAFFEQAVEVAEAGDFRTTIRRARAALDALP